MLKTEYVIDVWAVGFVTPAVHSGRCIRHIRSESLAVNHILHGRRVLKS